LFPFSPWRSPPRALCSRRLPTDSRRRRRRRAPGSRARRSVSATHIAKPRIVMSIRGHRANVSARISSVRPVKTASPVTGSPAVTPHRPATAIVQRAPCVCPDQRRADRRSVVPRCRRDARACRPAETRPRRRAPVRVPSVPCVSRAPRLADRSWADPRPVPAPASKGDLTVARSGRPRPLLATCNAFPRWQRPDQRAAKNASARLTDFRLVSPLNRHHDRTGRKGESPFCSPSERTARGGVVGPTTRAYIATCTASLERPEGLRAVGRTRMTRRKKRRAFLRCDVLRLFLY
jgi:hypothetical protein